MLGGRSSFVSPKARAGLVRKRQGRWVAPGGVAGVCADHSVRGVRVYVDSVVGATLGVFIECFICV